MTWKELKQIAKMRGMEVHKSWIRDKNEGMDYYEDGTIDIHFTIGGQERCGQFAEHRTPDKMWKIMEALQ